MKTCFMVMASLCVTLICNAQQIQPLKVGDQFPDFTFSKVINAPYTEVPYASMKNKVVVLDFFATWCSSCIALFPHLDSLKAKYGDQLEIFIVSREPRKKVAQMLKTKPVVKGFKLPFIIEDSTLYKLFPHSFIPHEVVLKDGKVAAITYPEFINEKTVGSLLDGRDVDLPVKLDIRYDPEKSMFENLVGSPIDLTIRKFLLTKHIDGLASIGGWAMSMDSSRVRYSKINNILLFYMFWAADMDADVRNRVILNVRDSSKFLVTGPSEFNWRKENTYGLEYEVPSNWPWSRHFSWVLKQLNLALDYNIFKNEQMVECWILKRVAPADKAYFIEEKINSKKERIFKNIKSLMYSLNYQHLGKPFVPIILDEVHDSTITNIRIKVTDIHNPLEVSNSLRAYGLCLKKVKRELPVLVIEDKKISNSKTD